MSEREIDRQVERLGGPETQLVCQECQGKDLHLFTARSGSQLLVRCADCGKWRMRCELVQPLPTSITTYGAN